MLSRELIAYTMISALVVNWAMHVGRSSWILETLSYLFLIFAIIALILYRLSNGTGDESFQASSISAAFCYLTLSASASSVSLVLLASNYSSARNFSFGKTISQMFFSYIIEFVISICFGDYSWATSETLALRFSKVLGYSSFSNFIFSVKAIIL
jgi:putative Ca2+/H+ antiporter (TMEM165/GDT1 family)